MTWTTGTTPLHYARCKVCGAVYSSTNVDVVAEGMAAHDKEHAHG